MLKKIFPLIAYLAMAGCVPMGDLIQVNGVDVVKKHDDFKGTTTYNSRGLDIETPFTLLGGYKVNMFIYRFESDKDKSALESLEVGLYGEGWCFIGDKDELNFLADGDKLTLKASAPSARDVMTGSVISETAFYDFTEKGKKFFEKHSNTAVRFQVNGERCKQEGTITPAGMILANNFLNAFSGGKIIPGPTPVPFRQGRK